MMKTTLPCRFILTCLILIAAVFGSSFTLNAQDFKGKDGAESYVLGTQILNRYTALAAPASAGSLSLTVSNISDLNGVQLFLNAANPYASNALAAGDLIMIIQMQGADMSTADDASYGNITSYNNTGNYELRTVYSVSGNNILLCQNLLHSYSQGGRARTQVIRVPRLTTLSVSSLATITGSAWNGTTGGVVVIETADNMAINGTVSADAIGYRGGIDDKANSINSGLAEMVTYRLSAGTAAGKGESIVGFTADYNTLNGANGRGAPANGGGGGNGHNAGGGGGSNVGTNGSLAGWNGTGIKNNSTATWTGAWNLESPNFATNVSVGGGRGGYSFSNSNQNALVLGPGQNAWGGNKRCNVGGLGGRPLDYDLNSRLFMGGGGGAGDGNNSSSGNGGAGGGIVFLFGHSTINGAGNVTANGQAGFNTLLTNIDGAGGGGAGGAIIVQAATSVTGISLQANGGNGGSQLLLTGEAEGPGGGGSGGYIATTPSTVNRQVNGATNGISNAAHLTEFLPNGATMGAPGAIVTIGYTGFYYCSPEGIVLPIRLYSFDAVQQNDNVKLAWVTESETNASHFEIERSFNGQDFSTIATVNATGHSSRKIAYAYEDKTTGNAKVVYYRLKMVDTDGRHKNSDIRIIRKETNNNASRALTTFPNPIRQNLYVTLPNTWQGKSVKFEVIDATGKIAGAVERKNANQTEAIDMQQFVTGFYVVRATSGDQVSQQRVIKN